MTDYAARLRAHASSREVRGEYFYVDLNQAANHIEDLEDQVAAYREVADTLLSRSSMPYHLERALHRLKEFHRQPEVLYQERMNRQREKES